MPSFTFLLAIHHAHIALLHCHSPCLHCPSSLLFTMPSLTYLLAIHHAHIALLHCHSPCPQCPSSLPFTMPTMPFFIAIHHAHIAHTQFVCVQNLCTTQIIILIRKFIHKAKQMKFFVMQYWDTEQYSYYVTLAIRVILTEWVIAVFSCQFAATLC